MVRLWTLLGPVAGFMLLAGVAQAAPPTTAADQTAIRAPMTNRASADLGGDAKGVAAQQAEVKHQVEQFADCWNRHDMKAFGELFAANAEFVNVVGIWWKGREAIVRAHQFTHSNRFKTSRLTVLETAIRSPQDGIAIARSRWRLEGHTAPDGSALPPRTGLLVNLLQRTETGWLIIDSQNTDIVEGALSRP